MSYQDPHWLEETHRGISSEVLADLAYRALMFGDDGEYATLKAELERREQEND